MSADCSRRRAPSRPLSGGRSGSDASGWPLLAVRQEGRGRCSEVWERGSAGGKRRRNRWRRGHQRRRGACGSTVPQLLGRAVPMVVPLRLVVRLRAGHLVGVARSGHLGVRRRLLLAQQRSCGYPSQGQQHRQQDENEDSQKLHGAEASTVGAVTLCVAASLCPTAACDGALTLRVRLRFRAQATIGVTCPTVLTLPRWQGQ